MNIPPGGNLGLSLPGGQARKGFGWVSHLFLHQVAAELEIRVISLRPPLDMGS